MNSGKNNDKKIIEIFTDGACRGNPGIGGWGALLRYQQHEKKIFGAIDHTTNNRMELTAVIEALKLINKNSVIHITTDSQYVKNGMTKWIFQWQKNDWQAAIKKNIKNLDLWQTLYAVTLQHEVTWHWVRGHSGHPENEIADLLANQAIDDLLKERKRGFS
jgi:ribonuclease HI